MNTRLSIQEKRALWVLTIIVLISRSAYALQNDRLIYGSVFVDDAYYALAVARHLALGYGFTADGIHLTNGFQPLNTLLQSLCFLVAKGDRLAGLRLCFVLAALTEAGFIWALASLISSMRRNFRASETWWSSPVIIAVVLQTFTYRLLILHVSGLETGLYALMILLVLSAQVRISSMQERGIVPNVWSFLWLGVLCGFLVLARIDGALLVVILAATQLRFPNGFRNGLTIGATALIISSPWWIYCYWQFGSFMPMSGQAESIFRWSVGSLLDASDAAGNIFFFWIPNASVQLPIWVSLPLFGAIMYLGIRMVRRYHLVRLIHSYYKLSALRPLLYFGMFLFFYYLFIFRATWFLERFWNPIELGWLILFSFGLSVIPEMLRTFAPPMRVWTIRAGVILMLSIAAINARWDRSRYLPKFPTDLAQLGFWATMHPASTIGVLQSGEAGFIADNIINLDGKVNPDALHARQHDSLGAYIYKMHFDYLADEARTVNMALEDSSRFGYHCERIDTFRSIRIYAVSVERTLPTAKN
jgi:hypothetical protein